MAEKKSKRNNAAERFDLGDHTIRLRRNLIISASVLFVIKFFDIKIQNIENMGLALTGLDTELIILILLIIMIYNFFMFIIRIPEEIGFWHETRLKRNSLLSTTIDDVKKWNSALKSKNKSIKSIEDYTIMDREETPEELLEIMERREKYLLYKKDKTIIKYKLFQEFITYILYSIFYYNIYLRLFLEFFLPILLFLTTLVVYVYCDESCLAEEILS